jgi:hypothetical protein
MHWTHDLELLFFGQIYEQVAKMLSPLTCNQFFIYLFCIIVNKSLTSYHICDLCMGISIIIIC